MSGERWTRAEEWRLLELRERRWSHDRIGAALGRTRRAVQVRLSILTREDPATRLSPKRVAHLVGVSGNAVVRWIAWGWLRARRDAGMRRGAAHCASRRRGEWRVDRTDLEAFLAVERYWPLWDPARVRDPDLRAWAVEMRRGVAFLRTHEVAARLGYCVRAAQTLIARGHLPGIKLRPGPGAAPPSAWWVRESDLERYLLRQEVA